MTDFDRLSVRVLGTPQTAGSQDPGALKGKNENRYAWEDALLKARNAIKGSGPGNGAASGKPGGHGAPQGPLRAGYPGAHDIGNFGAAAPRTTSVALEQADRGAGQVRDAMIPATGESPDPSSAAWIFAGASPGAGETAASPAAGLAGAMLGRLLLPGGAYTSHWQRAIVRLRTTEQGIDVYIRMYDLPDSELRAFLALISGNLKNLPMQVTSITVNGKRGYVRGSAPDYGWAALSADHAGTILNNII